MDNILKNIKQSMIPKSTDKVVSFVAIDVTDLDGKTRTRMAEHLANEVLRTYQNFCINAGRVMFFLATNNGYTYAIATNLKNVVDSVLKGDPDGFDIDTSALGYDSAGLVSGEVDHVALSDNEAVNVDLIGIMNKLSKSLHTK